MSTTTHIADIATTADIARPAEIQVSIQRGSTLGIRVRLRNGDRDLALPNSARTTFCWQRPGADGWWTKAAEHAEAGSGNGGQFVKKGEGVSGSGSKASGEYTAASPEVISRFQSELPEKISPEDFDSLLTAGFTDTDGAGNAVRYGSLLRDHWDDGEHSAKDIKKRKERLGIAVRIIRGAKPVATGNPQRPDERIYVRNYNGKAYIAIADEHNEIRAIEMVSYRGDRTRDE